MSALRRIKKVKGGYEVTVKCTGTPMQTRVFGSYQECEVFADDYFFDYLGVQLKCAHHPVGDGVEPEGLNPDSLETVEIEIPMTDEQASDWEYKIICCLGISTSNSDINVVGLHKTVKELYEQGRADEREAQVCCGDYEKCMKACTPRGRWLAEKELTNPEQKPVAWMMPDYGDVLSASEADGTGIYNIPLYTHRHAKNGSG